jgi:hypothetical protein
MEGRMDRQSLSPIAPVADRVVAFGANAMSNLSNQQLPSRGDPLPAFLQPECLLPVQYNALVRKRAAEQGESRLLLAVLKDALRSYIRNMHGRTAQARRDFEEISDWFYAEDQQGIFAYEQLCEALEIHPEPLRRWLKSLHNREGG